MSQLTMTFLRHSFSQGNAAHVFSGSADVPLAPEGEQMVRDYREQGIYEQHCVAQRYFSSPLQRCTKTFELAFDGKEQLNATIDNLKEVEFGEMEGKRFEPEQAHAFFADWAAGKVIEGAPHLETLEQLRTRGAGAVRTLVVQCAREGVECVTVVLHSAIGRAIMVELAGLPGEAWLEIGMPNALGYTLQLEVDLEADAPADQVRFVRADPYGPAEVLEMWHCSPVLPAGERAGA